MNKPLSPSLLAELSKFINNRLGLHFPPKRWPDLERGIRAAAEDFAFADVETCARWLLGSPLTSAQIETLAGHLTIGETYFFREKRAFEVLEKQILPPLISARREISKHLRIWCAGCATGEEAYSIAILLDRLSPPLTQWNISILATDINPVFLEKAGLGVYRNWSFRGMADEIKANYFTETERGFEILPRIKKNVTFLNLNLIEDTYPSVLNNTFAIDVIFCRNVMIYFDSEGIQGVVDKFYHTLITGGWLIVGSSETASRFYSDFAAINYPGITVYRKDNADSYIGQFAEITQSNCDTFAESVLVKPPTSSLGTESQGASFSGAPLSIEPSWQTRFEAAMELFEAGHYDQATAQFKALFAFADGNVPVEQKQVFYQLAGIYADQGLLDQAQRWCEGAISADKLNARAYYLLGIILQEQENINQATRAFKHALFLEPGFTLAMFALGSLARQRGEIAEATRQFETALTTLAGLTQDAVLWGSEKMTASELATILQTMLV